MVLEKEQLQMIRDLSIIFYYITLSMASVLPVSLAFTFGLLFDKSNGGLGSIANIAIALILAIDFSNRAKTEIRNNILTSADKT